MKLITIVGARPQFIKAAIVSREIAKHPDIKEIIIHTGQHFGKNMSEIFFEEMQITPKYNLNINSMNHGAMTGKMLEGIESILSKEKPNFVLVYGDTNSTLAGALAAKKLHIKVVHVEAGLRSFNMQMPEEINRILVDRISDILCCPTAKAVENLGREGFKNFPCRIIRSGDVMQDAALYYAEISGRKSNILQRLDLKGKDFVLCTIHREENTDNLRRLTDILAALNEISKEIEMVLPLHPRTAKSVKSNNLKMSFNPIDPVSYFDMIELLKTAKIVMTDSGGLQKEAFFFARPCVTLRDETEWVELIEKGFNVLAGADRQNIIDRYNEMKNRIIDFDVDLYGNGLAAKSILGALQAGKQKLSARKEGETMP